MEEISWPVRLVRWLWKIPYYDLSVISTDLFSQMARLQAPNIFDWVFFIGWPMKKPNSSAGAKRAQINLHVIG